MFFATLAILVAISAAEPPAPAQGYLPSSPGVQGGSGQSQGFRGSSFTGSSSSFTGSSSFSGSSSYGPAGVGVELVRSSRPQQEVERNAEVLRQDQDADDNGNFQYAYETSNGIRAAESGSAGGSQGEFSYQGDDGNTYSVSFRAGEGGFEAQGAHLPVAPPTPQAILAALEKNARDEASGIFDDGQYRPTGDDGQYRADPAEGYPDRASVRGAGQAAQAGRGQSGFGSGNRQGSFNKDSGYQY